MTSFELQKQVFVKASLRYFEREELTSLNIYVGFKVDAPLTRCDTLAGAAALTRQQLTSILYHV